MPGLRTPSAANRYAGEQLKHLLAAELLSHLDDAVTPLREFAHRTIRASDHIDSTAAAALAAEAIAALAHLHASDQRTERLQSHLLGAEALTGVNVGHIGEVTGLSHSTLTRRLANSPAALRGKDIAPDPTHEWGWRALT